MLKQNPGSQAERPPLPFVRPATPLDAIELAPRLRAEDVREIAAASGRSPVDSLLEAVLRSDRSFACLHRGEPIALFGICGERGSSPSGLRAGAPWLLASQEFFELRHLFLRFQSKWIRALAEGYDLLTNAADIRNGAHLKWIRWSGFRLGPTADAGREKRPFRQFSLASRELKRAVRAPHPLRLPLQTPPPRPRLAIPNRTEATDRVPGWRLEDLYGAADDPALSSDLRALRSHAEGLHEEFCGKLGDTRDDALRRCLERYTELWAQRQKIRAYVDLRSVTPGRRPDERTALAAAAKALQPIDWMLAFVPRELGRRHPRELARALRASGTADHQSWARRAGLSQPYLLREGREELISEFVETSRTGWLRQYSELCRSLVCEASEGSTSVERLLQSRAAQQGRIAAATRMDLARVIRTRHVDFGRNLLELMELARRESLWRGLGHPRAQRHLHDDTPSGLADGLCEAAAAHSRRIAHRYFENKAERSRQSGLGYTDALAPVAETALPRFDWPSARRLVEQSFGAFDSEMGAIARGFFDGRRVEARPSEDPGATCFSHPAAPGGHPYVRVQFSGRLEDVLELAHELGHGVHQYVTSTRGPLANQPPIALSEAAAAFGEILVVDTFLRGCADVETRGSVLQAFVQRWILQIFGALSAYRFERALAQARSPARLPLKTLDDLWEKSERAWLGAAVDLDDTCAGLWAARRSTYYTPFSSYRYPFGYAFAALLWSAYPEERSPRTYLDMLSCFGTGCADELIRHAGFDLNDPAVWGKGFLTIDGWVDACVTRRASGGLG